MYMPQRTFPKKGKENCLLGKTLFVLRTSIVDNSANLINRILGESIMD
jgi:hypothetical protein